MFTKIVDLFSALIFSTTTVVKDLPVVSFNGSNYPYGVVNKSFFSFDELKVSMFDKPVYFLGDVNTFLQRWDLFFSLSRDSSSLDLNIYLFPDCDSTNTVGAKDGKMISSLKISSNLFTSLSNNFRLAYQFSDRVLALGDKKYVSFSLNSLFDYYSQNNDFKAINFLKLFLLSFMEYNCKTGINFMDSLNTSSIYLVPKGNNLSGINLRYLYLAQYYKRYFDIKSNYGFSFLSVDLRNRYSKDNLLVYPVISGSSYLNLKFLDLSSFYSARYINLFSTGLSTSFSYNTIVISLPTFIGTNSSAIDKASVIRFMNFSMLDATTVTGGNTEGNPSGGGLFDEVSSTSCVGYDVFCHLTSAVKGVMNNIIGFKQLYKLVNLFFTPMTLTLKTYKQYNVGLGDMPLVSPVIVSGAMLLVLFNFYRRFK